MGIRNSCCKDVHQFFVLDNDQSQQSATEANPPDHFELRALYTTSLIVPVLSVRQFESFSGDRSPPPRERLFVLYQSLVFYS
jgi:hypothetical protein